MSAGAVDLIAGERGSFEVTDEMLERMGGGQVAALEALLLAEARRRGLALWVSEDPKGNVRRIEWGPAATLAE